MKLKKSDIIMLVIILVVGIGCYVFLQNKKTDGGKVQVLVNGEEYAVLDLNEDTTLTIEQENGSTNTVIVEDGYARMVEASCPDQVCVHQSHIHYKNEMIICLPNYLILQVIEGEDASVDSVVN